ncbi:uncharacterized protein [Fopius arisanus]|uniref:OB domain-containing protein n=1 Tax=Fopius arisanus TaxID=64838 RepID=A0A9R1UAC0_9HYME|nr:PREDICTED: uncharacterized protein LOC105272789 [Fopius arisanus]
MKETNQQTKKMKDTEKMHQSEDDFESLMTPSERIKEIKSNEKSIELVVTVSCIDGYKLIHSHKKNKDIGRYQFKMHAKDHSTTVQFLAWENDAKRLSSVQLSPGDIIHIDSLTAKPIETNFNKGTVPIQLLGNSATTITILKEKGSDGRCGDMEAEIPFVKKFDAIPQHTGIISSNETPPPR